MIGLDTKVLLRAITLDDPGQSQIARRILERLSDTEPGYINSIVLSALAWTLERRHKYKRGEVIAVISGLLGSTSLVVADRDVVRRALSRAEEDDLDFPDAMLSELNIAAGCLTTLSFNRKAASTSGFTLPS